MARIDLCELGLSEKHIQEATMYSPGLYFARVSVQHKELYKVLTEEGLFPLLPSSDNKRFLVETKSKSVDLISID